MAEMEARPMPSSDSIFERAKEFMPTPRSNPPSLSACHQARIRAAIIRGKARLACTMCGKPIRVQNAKPRDS